MPGVVRQAFSLIRHKISGIPDVTFWGTPLIIVKTLNRRRLIFNPTYANGLMH